MRNCYSKPHDIIDSFSVNIMLSYDYAFCAVVSVSGITVA